ncbi:hypothetical protein [Brevibacterium linens]|uniref:Uncharacterized protein n=1 Tax=Brevibacterium linens TaxID=1703 RepID=A0A2H1JUV2_BRELN|nr:hypothetical protein [Brevibacterium linens]SMX91239.1 hypothetical protein BLIN101_02693 [Brevibacterium linens]
MNSFPHPPPHHDGGHQHQQPYSAPSSPLPLTPQRSTKHIWFGLGGLVIGLLLGVGTVGGIVGISSLAEADAQAAQAELMADGYETCSLGSVDGATLSADRLSVDFDGAGMYFGPDLADVYCLGDALGMPDSVSSRMGQTRALDGTQTAEWDSFSVSWNYHPDDGLGAIFEYVPDS